MDYSVAREIIACLPKGRTLFYYFPDRYAIYLLSRFIRDGRPINEVKASPFGKLLQRPAIKPVMAAKGDGLLRTADLANCYAVQPEYYLLTLGKWGPEKRNQWNRYHHQTSRPGMNLVLQLNFSSLHNKPYRALIKPGRARPFETSLHPIARKGFHTLAWARFDIDMQTGEALIEEVQTDWLRFASLAKNQAQTALYGDEMQRAVETVYFNGAEIDPEAMRTYFNHVLDTHIRMWDEAMLTAAIDFLVEEIGIHRIYMHDFDCGCRLKGIDGRQPPRSLYTKLPSRFCFTKVTEAPDFLAAKPTRTLKTLDRAKSVRFWRLEI